MPALSQTGDHFVVCGDDPLAYRIAEELTSRYGEQVTVILPSRRRNEGPRISALPRIRVLESAELTAQAFADADVQSARAVALVSQDDLGNFHAALRAQELNASLRLVLAIFNRRLGEHIRGFFPDCTVLSGTAMSAPSFVAAALGELAPSHIRVSGRTLYVARREDVTAGQVVCGVATLTADPAAPPRLLPPDARPGPGSPDLVLAVADGTPRNPLTRRRNPLLAVAGVTRRMALSVFGLVFIVLLSVILVGFVLLATAARYPISNALYLTIMDLTGSALTNPALGGPEKISQVILTVDGLAFIPVITALIVGARLTGSVRGTPRPPGGHVIVVGLGNVGTRVVGELHDLGFDVVCVDSNPNARGIPVARRMGLPVVIGEAYQEETLRAASLETSIALVSVTSRDIVNLETGLNARALRADLRIVLRLSNDDLAQRVQETVGNSVSRSVPYLAAPAFAAALLEHQVLRTIAVGRHVLLIADVRVEADSDLAGHPIDDVERDGQAWILALQVGQATVPDWSPRHGYLLAPGDRVVVLATRAGLGRFLTGSRSDTARLPGRNVSVFRGKPALHGLLTGPFRPYAPFGGEYRSRIVWGRGVTLRAELPSGNSVPDGNEKVVA